jgi:hypothetical protein
LAAVRTDAAAKPLAGLDFGTDKDCADGADGCAPPFSGAGWLEVVAMLMVRVRARPSRPKPISMPILRKKVAARRSLPANARGLSGQVLDLAARSPTTSTRAPRRSEALPIHSVHVVRECSYFRGVNAAASLKVGRRQFAEPLFGALPRRECRGLIEGFTSACTAVMNAATSAA